MSLIIKVATIPAIYHISLKLRLFLRNIFGLGVGELAIFVFFPLLLFYCTVIHFVFVNILYIFNLSIFGNVIIIVVASVWSALVV